MTVRQASAKRHDVTRLSGHLTVSFDKLRRWAVNQLLTFACPVCGHGPHEKRELVQVGVLLPMRACQTQCHIGYDDKLRLFAAHERKGSKSDGSSP